TDDPKKHAVSQQILHFLLSEIDLRPWLTNAEILGLRPDLHFPPRCWICLYYIPQRVPSAELKAYLKSDDYQRFNEEHHIKLVKLDKGDKRFLEGEIGEEAPWIQVEPIDRYTGELHPLFKKYTREPLCTFGFCQKNKKMVSLGYTCDQYTIRELIPPIESVFYQPWEDSDWYYFVELDQGVHEYLDEWFDQIIRHKHDRYYVDGFTWFLTDALHSYQIDRSLGDCIIHYNAIIRLDDSGNDLQSMEQVHRFKCRLFIFRILDEKCSLLDPNDRAGLVSPEDFDCLLRYTRIYYHGLAP
ncbi:MAG TPA: hypothetical protein VMV49_09820, partial [Candidatus Deferrimicrobium sp.]|nr:hypothetical protein [Candidatus Deferrimicrobium sp.]